jgi:hypothetical protein
MDQSLADRSGRAENAYTSLGLGFHFLSTNKIVSGFSFRAQEASRVSARRVNTA